jgi:lysophospholipase L1-like esterase
MRRASVALVVLFLLSGCVGSLTGGPPPQPTRPFSVVVHGDSFTAALDPGRGDRREISWASGTEPGLPSIRQELQSVHPGARVENVAFSGARMRDVALQAERAGSGADLVLVFLGINDLCVDRSPQSHETFSSDARAAFDLIRARHPGARVVVFAVPDLWRLHELHLEERRALELWRQIPDYCPEFFNPVPGPAAFLLAHDRLEDTNAALRQAARDHGFAYSDATLWPGWGLADFSEADFFHPSLSGEARLAAALWPDIPA